MHSPVPIRVDCGLPLQLRKGQNMPLKLRVDTFGSPLRETEVSLVAAGWYKGGLEQSVGKMEPWTTRTAVFNLELVLPGPVLLKFAVKTLEPGRKQRRLFVGVLEMTIERDFRPGDVAYHVHVTGKSVTHAGGQKEGFGQADEISMNVNLPPAPQESLPSQSFPGGFDWVSDVTLKEEEVRSSPIVKFIFRKTVAAVLLILSMGGLGFKRAWDSGSSKASATEVTQTSTNNAEQKSSNSSTQSASPILSQQASPTVSQSVTVYVNGERVTRPEEVSVRPSHFEVGLDKLVYRNNDHQKIRVSIPQDGCLYVFGLGCDGVASLYYPSLDHPDPLVKGLGLVELPTSGGTNITLSFPSTVHAGSAVEQIIAVLCPSPLLEVKIDEGADQMAALIKEGILSLSMANQATSGHLDHEVSVQPSKGRLAAVATYRIER